MLTSIFTKEIPQRRISCANQIQISATFNLKNSYIINNKGY